MNKAGWRAWASVARNGGVAVINRLYYAVCNGDNFRVRGVPLNARGCWGKRKRIAFICKLWSFWKMYCRAVLYIYLAQACFAAWFCGNRRVACAYSSNNTVIINCSYVGIWRRPCNARYVISRDGELCTVIDSVVGVWELNLILSGFGRSRRVDNLNKTGVWACACIRGDCNKAVGYGLYNAVFYRCNRRVTAVPLYACCCWCKGERISSVSELCCLWEVNGRTVFNVHLTSAHKTARLCGNQCITGSYACYNTAAVYNRNGIIWAWPRNVVHVVSRDSKLSAVIDSIVCVWKLKSSYRGGSRCGGFNKVAPYVSGFVCSQLFNLIPIGIVKLTVGKSDLCVNSHLRYYRVVCACACTQVHIVVRYVSAAACCGRGVCGACNYGESRRKYWQHNNDWQKNAQWLFHGFCFHFYTFNQKYVI